MTMIPMIPMISAATTPTDACAPAWLRDLKLGYGTGKPGECGCWLVALQLFEGSKDWDGAVPSIDPVISEICAAINDSFGIGKEESISRTRLIQEFGVLRPLSTKGGLQLSRRRAVLLTDAAIRRWLPVWCEADGALTYQNLFKNQRPIRYISQATTLSVTLEHTDAGKYVRDLYGIAESSPAKVAMQLGCILTKTATASMLGLNPVDAVAARDRFLREQVLPALQEALELGQRVETIGAEPACGTAEFYRLLNL